MITGRRAFHGDSKLSALSAILKEEPKPATSIVRDVPRDLEKIVSHCLRKDPERRFQHLGDVKVALARSNANTACDRHARFRSSRTILTFSARAAAEYGF